MRPTRELSSATIASQISNMETDGDAPLESLPPFITAIDSGMVSMPTQGDSAFLELDDDLNPNLHDNRDGNYEAAAAQVEMNTTDNMTAVAPDAYPITWSEPRQTEYGYSMEDDITDTPTVTQNRIDKQWFRSKNVRTRCHIKNGVQGTSGTFHLTEGLDPEKAHSYFNLLTYLKGKLTHPNACVIQNTDLEYGIDIYSTMPSISVSPFSQAYLIQHYLEGKRQETDISQYFGVRHHDLLALPSGCLNDNVFTAASTFTIGDASNAIPLRVEVAISLLTNRLQYLEDYSQDYYADALMECMSPKGVTNPCLLQALSSVLSCNVSVFSYSVFMGDVHTTILDLSSVYSPYDGIADCQHLQHMALFVVPTQSSPLTYLSYSVVMREDVLLIRNVLRENHAEANMFYDKLNDNTCDNGHQTHPIQIKLERQLKYMAKAIKLPYMCPLDTCIEPRDVLLEEEDDANRPIKGPGIFPNDFLSRPYDEMADRGYFQNEGYWARKFMGFKGAYSFLSRFVEENGAIDLYPLFPYEGDIFVCAIDDSRQTRHSGFGAGSHPQQEFYHPDT